MILQDQVFNSMISVAEIFTGFPLYYKNFLDYRTRLYVYAFLFSRTSGFFKHLVTDYKQVKLTVKGLENMLRAYYSLDELKLENFEKFLKSTSNHTLFKLS